MHVSWHKQIRSQILLQVFDAVLQNHNPSMIALEYIKTESRWRDYDDKLLIIWSEKQVWSNK
jgi:hypothetical protein